MNLQRIRETIAAYGQEFPHRPNGHLWQIQKTFQDHWDLNAPDLVEMIDQSIQSQVNRRMWSREGYQPKQVLMAFTSMEPLLVHAMFTDLFHSGRDLQGRISRFQFHADELLHSYRERGYKPAYAGHDQDLPIITFYLAMRYPAQHGSYDHHAFVRTLETLQVTSLPQVPDPERWVKVARTLLNFMQKDEPLMQAYELVRQDPLAYQDETLLLVWDYMQWLAGQP